MPMFFPIRHNNSLQISPNKTKKKIATLRYYCEQSEKLLCKLKMAGREDIKETSNGQ